MLTYTYLAEDTDYEEFGPNELADYELLVMYGFGSDAKKVSQAEENFIAANFAKKWRKSMLVVSAEKITKQPTGNFLKSICGPFEPEKQKPPFVAAMSVHAGLYDAVLLKPLVQTLAISAKSAKATSLYQRFAEALDVLLITIANEYLEKVAIALPPKAIGSVIPFGSKIQEIEDEISKVQTPSYGLDAKTMGLAKRFNPIARESILKISAALSTPWKELIVDPVCPDHSEIKKLRAINELDQVALSRLVDPRYPDLVRHIEIAPTVSAQIMWAIHRAFTGIQKTHMDELIDLEATSALNWNH